MRTIALSVTVCGLVLAVASISVGNDFDVLLQDLSFGDAPSARPAAPVPKRVEVAKSNRGGMFMPVAETPAVTLQSPQNVVVAEADVDFAAIFDSQESKLVVAEPVSLPMDMHPEMISVDAEPMTQIEAPAQADVIVQAPAIEAPAVVPPAIEAPVVEAPAIEPREVVPPAADMPVQPEPVAVEPELLPVHPQASHPDAPVVMPLNDPQFIESAHCGAGCDTGCDSNVITCRPHMKPNLPYSTFYQYFRSNPCYSNVWDGYRQHCSVHHSHIHGTCDCFKKNRGVLGVKKKCGCSSCDSCDR